MKSNVVVIPYGKNANLRIRRDKIIATVNIPGSDNIDIYTQDTMTPWHVSNVSSDEIIDLIWEVDN